MLLQFLYFSTWKNYLNADYTYGHIYKGVYFSEHIFLSNTLMTFAKFNNSGCDLRDGNV